MSGCLAPVGAEPMIVAHRPQWADDYRREADRLDSLGIPGFQCHHIGSTAVPGLLAKPCLDLLGVILDIESVRRRADRIESLGYQHRGEYGISGREYFAQLEPRVHLHVFAEGHPQIERHLEFVRCLRQSPALVEAFNALKRSLVDRHPGDKAAYQAGKARFYDRILGKREVAHDD